MLKYEILNVIVFASSLQGFRSFILVSSDEFCPPPKQRGSFFNVAMLYSKYYKYPSFIFWNVGFRGFQVWHLVSSNGLWPPPITIRTFLLTRQVHTLSVKKDLPLRTWDIIPISSFYKVFVVSPLVTLDEVWPPPYPKQFHLLIRKLIYLRNILHLACFNRREYKLWTITDEAKPNPLYFRIWGF